MLVSLVECYADFSSFYSERGGFPHSQSMTSLISEVCCVHCFVMGLSVCLCGEVDEPVCVSVCLCVCVER